jgi:hypothetical protein
MFAHHECRDQKNRSEGEQSALRNIAHVTVATSNCMVEHLQHAHAVPREERTAAMERLASIMLLPPWSVQVSHFPLPPGRPA